jgi:DNA adenine methylase
MRPFLKWAGGKYRIVSKIKATLPDGFRLIEPFVGSGAVFLNTDYTNYILADSNRDLINIYQHLKEEKQQFIEYCLSFFDHAANNEKKFLHNRELFNTTTCLRLKAALFLYLNRHSYNGLIRYNSKGKFNVPFGKYKKPYFPAKEMINFAEKTKSAHIYHADFLDTMQKAKAGDVVYCDPPYMPLSETAKFTQYETKGFGINEQVALINVTKKIIKRGVTVIISNHDTTFINQLYEGAKIHRFNVQRQISCNGSNRKPAKELLAIFL